MADSTGNLDVDHQKNIATGQFGDLYEGLFQNRTRVAVTFIAKKELYVDVEILSMAQQHTNIIKYYCTEENSQFQ